MSLPRHWRNTNKICKPTATNNLRSIGKRVLPKTRFPIEINLITVFWVGTQGVPGPWVPTQNLLANGPLHTFA